MFVFDGTALAIEKEKQLASQVEAWLHQGGQRPVIAAILFREDTGSQLYTRLKREAAGRVGIEYRVHEFSFSDPVEKVRARILELNTDSNITGIIVQKPWRKLWLTSNSDGDYAIWWHELMSAVEVAKDVDGLHPQTLAAIKAGTWQSDGRVLPATCRAVLLAIDAAAQSAPPEGAPGKNIIIGRSDLLGLPLYYVLQERGLDVELIGFKELEVRKASGQFLLDAQMVISATGQKNLVTGEMVRDGVAVIDVGEPSPDIDRDSVASKARFLTPVPGGIGPLTVTFLLDNAMILASK